MALLVATLHLIIGCAGKKGAGAKNANATKKGAVPAASEKVGNERTTVTRLNVEKPLAAPTAAPVPAAAVTKSGKAPPATPAAAVPKEKEKVRPSTTSGLR